MDSSDISGATIFANVKSKLTNFHPSDLLPSFGFLKRKNRNQSEDGATKCISACHEGISNEPPLTYSLNQDHDLEVKVPLYSENLKMPGAYNLESLETNDCDILNSFASTLAESAENSAIDNVCQYYYDIFSDEKQSECHYDTLEVQHFGTYKGLKTLGKQQLGVGHKFEIDQLNQATFCDKCGDFILGLYKQAIRCRKCHYVCHYKCHNLVNLDCRSTDDTSENKNNLEANSEAESLETIKSDLIETLVAPEDRTIDVDVFQQSDKIDNKTVLTSSFEKLIREYNMDVEEGLRMLLDDNCDTFHGFVQIYMNLSRPVNVVDNEKPCSIYDVINAEETLKSNPPQLLEPTTITSFFLPRNSAKILHINSLTTTRRLIAALLKKFKVADNPLKFALYERNTAPGQTLQTRLRRIADDAYPLHILLQWGSRSNKCFVLQENDTGDIIWEYFEIPELETFLKILDKEECQYIAQIKQKYDAYRFYLQTELKERGQPINYMQCSDAAVVDDVPKFVKDDLFKDL